jgi:hypothetical protein
MRMSRKQVNDLMLRSRLPQNCRLTKRSKKQNKAICKGKSVHRLTTKRRRAYFRKTTSFICLNFSMGRPDHLGYIAAPRNRGRSSRHQLIHHCDRKPRCTAGLRRCASPLLCTAYASASCSILPLRLCFFGEIGCPILRRCTGQVGFVAIFKHFLASSFFCSQAVFSPAAANANRWTCQSIRSVRKRKIKFVII